MTSRVFLIFALTLAFSSNCFACDVQANGQPVKKVRKTASIKQKGSPISIARPDLNTATTRPAAEITAK